MALAVTSTVAPVSARMAGHRPVTPITVVTRKIAFRPRAMVMFWRILPHHAPRQVDHVGNVLDAAMKHRRISRLQGHVGAAPHGDADVGGGERRRIIDAVADLGDDKAFGLAVP